MPTLGSKEAIFSFAQVVVDARASGSSPYRSPAYPVYERGALFAGAEVVTLPLREEHGWLPDLDAFDRWDELALFWTNYPNNPTGATAPLDVLRGARGARPRARLPARLGRGVHGALVRRAAASALQVADRDERRRLQHAVEALVDDRLPLGVRRAAAGASSTRCSTFRPSSGTAPQEFVQRASVAAWSDEAHVERTRALYRREA